MSDLAVAVDAFVRDSADANAKDAEERFLPLLTDVMAGQGFDVVPRVRPHPNTTDYVGAARLGGPQRGRVGIEYKHYAGTRPVDARGIEQVVRLARNGDLDRALLVSKSGFSASAQQAAAETYPVRLELLSLDDFRRLAVNGEPEPSASSRIAALVRAVSEEMARIVARDPRALDHLEWRDLERMMTVVLQGLGFDAELTPGSKDGGKDIILRLAGPDGTRTYVVELKHWRSGKGVGLKAVREFVGVVARERHESGLFLSTNGYTSALSEALTEVERSKVRLGGEDKVVSLCRTYVKSGPQLWRPGDPDRLPEMLFADTA